MHVVQTLIRAALEPRIDYVCNAVIMNAVSLNATVMGALHTYT